MTTTKKPIAKSATVTDNVKDYGNDPFVVRKNERAKEVLEKYGFPKEFDSAPQKKN